MAPKRPDLGRADAVARPTLVLAYVPMGLFTPMAGIAIAFIKASFVILLFMEFDVSEPLIRLAAMAGLVFLTVLFTLTLPTC